MAANGPDRGHHPPAQALPVPAGNTETPL